jgi:hypothetical protein
MVYPYARFFVRSFEIPPYVSGELATQIKNRTPIERPMMPKLPCLTMSRDVLQEVK